MVEFVVLMGYGTAEAVLASCGSLVCDRVGDSLRRRQVLHFGVSGTAVSPVAEAPRTSRSARVEPVGDPAGLAGVSIGVFLRGPGA
jgi:hypothetical protein